MVAMLNQPTEPNIQDLRFNVSQLLKEVTGSKRRFRVETSAFANLIDDVMLVDPLVGDIEFLRTGRDVLATGTLETTVKKSCGRD